MKLEIHNEELAEYWCKELVDHLIHKLKEEEFNIWVTYMDGDTEFTGEPEIIINWNNSGMAHCRLLMGNEGAFVRYAFGSLGVQGLGGIRIPDIDPTFKGIDLFIDQVENYKKIVNYIITGNKNDNNT